MFTLYWIVFAPAQKPYRIGILFTHNNGDFGAISVTERSCAAPIPKVERHISDRCSYLPDSLFAPAQKPYRIGILFTRKNGDFGAISVTERSCAALIPKEEHHISDRWSYLPDSLFAPAQKSINQSINLYLNTVKSIRNLKIKDNLTILNKIQNLTTTNLTKTCFS